MAKKGTPVEKVGESFFFPVFFVAAEVSRRFLRPGFFFLLSLLSGKNPSPLPPSLFLTGFPGHGLGQQRLSRARRPVEQDA